MMLLLWSTAFAGWIPERFQHVDLKEVVGTPFGPLSRKIVLMVCFVPELRIGTITATRPFLKDLVHDPLNPDPGRGFPYSEITFATDRILRGPVVDAYAIDVSGGLHKGEWFDPGPQAPHPVVGWRYLTGTSPLNADPEISGWRRFDQPIIWGTLKLDPQQPLPATETLLASVNALCAREGYLDP